MRVVPWSQIKSWHCIACGKCCKHYDVVLKFPEWLNIVKTFGINFTSPSISKFFLRRRTDGSCIFLYETRSRSFCSLQEHKPQACKLWPFKISDTPKFGNQYKATYFYRNRRLFVYVDSACHGLRFGEPSKEFSYSVLPEFVEIALGLQRRQFKTTALP
ncbi:MAG: YkgJ family cysteine cluster protein [Candidatus Bathyarchaeota archaeon]|nr:MAG: YkgJ family cysteine cluster protein [Candidatus Bathyarchaeota archaeon]